MEMPKSVSLKNEQMMENTEKETAFYKDIRFWLALVMALLLVYMIVKNYP
jgi:hypothetical protein